MDSKKGEATLSKFFIVLCIAGLLFMGMFTLINYLDDEYTEYSYEDDIDNLGSLEKLQELQSQMNETKNDIENINSDNPLDVAGTYLRAGVDVAKTSFISLDIATDVASESADQIKGDATVENADAETLLDTLNLTLTTILLIVVIITIVLALVLGRKT